MSLCIIYKGTREKNDLTFKGLSWICLSKRPPDMSDKTIWFRRCLGWCRHHIRLIQLTQLIAIRMSHYQQLQQKKNNNNNNNEQQQSPHTCLSLIQTDSSTDIWPYQQLDCVGKVLDFSMFEIKNPAKSTHWKLRSQDSWAATSYLSQAPHQCQSVKVSSLNMKKNIFFFFGHLFVTLFRWIFRGKAVWATQCG